jgi:hypothetical protein
MTAVPLGAGGHGRNHGDRQQKNQERGKPAAS